jgi:PhnB protein
MSYKPDGYNDLSPYLVVDDARDSIAFLVRVFDATRLRTIEGADGRLAHGEVRIGDSVVMLADALEGWPAVPAHVHIYVPDVDAAWRRAMDAGATAVQAPMQKDDPDRRGGFRDAGGTTWWISQQMG